jgi:hypothetical protein
MSNGEQVSSVARNAAFVSAIMESGVEFAAVDNPTAARLTHHILAAVAEHELDMISARTNAALAAAKAKARNLVAIVRDIEGFGVVTLSGIARALEARGGPRDHAALSKAANRAQAAPEPGAIRRISAKGASTVHEAKRLAIIALPLPGTVSMRQFYPLGAILAFALSSCSTAGQMEANRIANTAKETTTAAAACVQSVHNNKDYEKILTKVYLSTDGSPAPLEMLTNKSFPTKQEILVLYKLYQDVQGCKKIALEGLSKISPLVSSAGIESSAEGDKLWIELVNGRLSYGDFNAGSKDNAARFAVKINQADQQISSQLQNQHQAEVAQRQQAINSGVDSMQQSIQAGTQQRTYFTPLQMGTTPLQKSTQTNCTNTFNGMNCTTY